MFLGVRKAHLAFLSRIFDRMQVWRTKEGNKDLFGEAAASGASLLHGYACPAL